MSSKSKSSAKTSQTTNDNRVLNEGAGTAVSGGGDVSVHIVPDEAFELGARAIESGEISLDAALQFGESALDRVTGGFSEALNATQAAITRANESEGTALSSDIIKIGIPAAALAYVVATWGK